jgi:VanZ family protein
MSDETAAVAVEADSFLRQPEPAAKAASTSTVMSFLIVARHSLPESRRFSKPNNDEAKTRPSAEQDFNLDSAAPPLFHPAVSGKGLFFKYSLPVVLWMGLIFGGSTDLLSSQRSSRIIGPLLRWLNPNISDKTIRGVQTVVRKGGHVAEYSVLAVLLWRARRKPFKNDPRPWSWHEATVVVFYSGLYGATDEFHQWFIPSRGASVWDAFLDTLAASAGLLLLWRLGRKRRLW